MTAADGTTADRQSRDGDGGAVDHRGLDAPTRTNPLWYVVLFSVPPGVGMAGFVASVTGETVSALSLATGLVTTLAIALFVLLALRSGEGAA
ncbi:hypothetical protein [Halomarina litorea]|uniref:hypothetical protein n=1 Tax=Halomarina litorea TaxID=2961595 RepID=UPI0020C22A59|nr:hypothetical protein [Halomarina sp. BCD28]